MLTFSNIYKKRLFWVAIVLTTLLVVFCVPIALDLRQLDVNNFFVSPLEITNISRMIILFAFTFLVGICLFLSLSLSLTSSKKKSVNYMIVEDLLFGYSLILIFFFGIGLFRKLYLNSGVIMSYESIGVLAAIAFCFSVDVWRRNKKKKLV
jgi:hypothetical protein